MIEILTGFIFVSSLAGLHKYLADITHPYFWSNLSFLFYGFSLVYLYVNGIEGARFLVLAGINVNFNTYLTYAACIILVAKFSLEALLRKPRIDLHKPIRLYNISGNQILLLRTISLMFCAVGFGYWLYVTAIITGGSFRILSNIGVFKHVIGDSGLSTIYFQFLYIGAQLWFLSFFLRGPEKSLTKYLFFIPAFIVMLTTGRLSQSFLLLITPVFFAMVAVNGTVPFRRVRLGMIVSMAAIFTLYFYRQYTSFSYIGKTDAFYALLLDGSGFTYLLESIVGSGNFPDPQQLILLLDGLVYGKLQWAYGSTYFDWLLNFMSVGDVQSVGYRILNAYFPEKVGGPTPGATGEAILNFGPFFPFVLMLFGYLMVSFHRYSKRNSSVLVKFIYLKVLLHFWALFIKVDSSLLLGLAWQIIPISVIWIILMGHKKQQAVTVGHRQNPHLEIQKAAL